ncbi:MAG: MotA/TolQ/ExbB proton channel family protein [Alphaproteobacteria bacterium]
MAEGYVTQSASPGRRRLDLDLATVAGLAGGLVLLAGGVLMGGPLTSFLDAPSLLIVVGGTLAVTTTCFSLDEMRTAARAVSRAVVRSPHNPSHAALRVIQVAEYARRSGILGLQGAMLDTLRTVPFLHKGLAMVVDGSVHDEVQTVMQAEIQALAGRHATTPAILRKAAEVSPAMGLIGTMIGLVQMLGHLSDPAAIGPSMAVALITTFYGAILAHMVFAPLAAKLERNSAEESMVLHVYMLGVISIARQENPRRLEALINSVLAPAQRVRYFD